MDDARLPRTARPVRYALDLRPDLDQARFDATVTVELVHADAAGSEHLVLNAAELDIHRATLDGEPLHPVLDADAERLTLTRPDGGRLTGAQLVIEYSGVLNDRLRGFYRSTYTAADGSTATIATTQFQPTDARRAFPCWDEPDLKAVFSVTLTVDADHLAVSNAAEIERTDLGDGRHRVRFADTIPMSTYLVAFVVGPLEATDPVDVEGTPVRIVHRPGQGHLTAYGLRVAAAALEYFPAYYGMPVPGGKVDLIAVPDFAFGAMENLGCITFREVYLLVDPDTVNQRELQSVADVINHELAHLWFGDLVTMRWWNGIWLNEAFATFMETNATEHFRPDWEPWNTFALSRSAAFDVDALASTRAVEYPVRTPEDAEGMFDILTYEKGASVVRMLERYVGPERFRDGIRLYLSRHIHANTETHDLWDALEEVTGEPVRALMDSWIFQGGYPVLSIGTGQDGSTLVRQERFVLDPDTADHDRWIVPVRARHADGSISRFLLEGDTVRLPDDGIVGLNAEASGFYRVHLDRPHVAELARTGAQALGPTERYALVDDTWALTRNGTSGVDTFLELAAAFVDETELSVWRRLGSALAELDHIADPADRPALAAWIHALVTPGLDRLGLDVDPADDDRRRELRATLFELDGTVGDHLETLTSARCLFTDEGADASLAAAAVRVVAAHGDAALHDELVQRYRGASTPQAEQRYLYALGDLPDADLVQRTCELALTDAVRSQNTAFLLQRLLRNRDHGATAWDFVEAHWVEIVAKVPGNSLPRVLDGIRSLTDPGLAERVRTFLAARPETAESLLVRQSIELMDVSVAFARRERPRLASALT